MSLLGELLRDGFDRFAAASRHFGFQSMEGQRFMILVAGVLATASLGLMRVFETIAHLVLMRRTGVCSNE